MMRGRNISSSCASALLATSCLLLASGTVAYHAVKYKDKCKLAQKQQQQQQQQQNVAARTIQAAWRRRCESYRRTSPASAQPHAAPSPTSTTATCSPRRSRSIPAMFYPFLNVGQLLRGQPQQDMAVASPGSDNHTLVPDDNDDDDDESSMNSQDHLALSSPTSTTSTTTTSSNNNKWILLDDRHEYHRFLSMPKTLVVLLLVAMAMEFALSTGYTVHELVSLNSPRLNGFRLASWAHHHHYHYYQTTTMTTTTLLEKHHHKIEWQSLPLYFGAK